MGNAPVFPVILPGTLQNISQLDGGSPIISDKPNQHGHRFPVAQNQNRVFRAGFYVVLQPGLNFFQRGFFHGSTSSPSMNRRLPSFSPRARRMTSLLCTL